jgi:hypothetical protein
LKASQGDQIGRIFAHWAIVFFGQLNENYRSSANSWATFFPYQLCINFDGAEPDKTEETTRVVEIERA